MLTAGDFKNGVTFEMDGKVYQVIEFQHVKPGKGAAFVRTKYRDVMTGAIREQSFNPTAKFENAVIERRDLQYSYDDGDLYHFMDTLPLKDWILHIISSLTNLKLSPTISREMRVSSQVSVSMK